ncbi:helix-turn-helix domain-containing protein [Streptomyces sp. NBC_00145]|uniref:helix-turn-helix domain-containing protein n=1 Tax=Streptomyces sp. NBC_00145 TaxID=2975666 RepID=UPI002E182D61
MHAHSHDHTGARIARLRRVRHLTQVQLADLARLSMSIISKIEQGREPATPFVITQVAAALRVGVGEITGQPYAQELRADELDVLVRPIREALDVYDLGADPGITPRSLDVLSSEAKRLCVQVRAGEIRRAGSDVAGLIQEATTAAHQHGTTEGWNTLGSFFRTAYDVTTKLGYSDLAALSLTRMDWTAQRASNAVVGGMYHYMRALTHLREGQYRTGDRLVRLGLSVLEQAEPTREQQVVTGQLHLGAAVMAGRAKNEDVAEGHLQEATRIAEGTGEAAETYWLTFGPTNVKVHRVSVLAELDKYGEVIEASFFRLPADWPKSRISHHYAEVAQAQMWENQIDASFKSLVAARKAAPQQAKYHPTVRETYAALEAAHRRLPNSFLSYGSWLGPGAH